jgi:aminoglycoside phosphotransferase (APT) family kinase protein
MRSDWVRERPVLGLSRREAELLVRRAFPTARISSLRVVGGGLSNTNLRVGLVAPAAPLRLRLYERGRAPAQIERYWLTSLAGRVPVPTLRYFALRASSTNGPVALLDWVEGLPLARVLPRLGEEAAGRLGSSVGTTLARIHARRFARAGRLDARGRVVRPLRLGAAGLVEFIDRCLTTEPACGRIGRKTARAVLDAVRELAPALDAARSPPVLVHGDFGGSNILVRNGERGWGVAAVLDWEYAHSGTPLLDVGNLLRPPTGARSSFVGAFHRGYTSAGGTLPGDWVRLSRIVDLSAWAEFLGRPAARGAVIRDARRALRAVIGRSRSPSRSPGGPQGRQGAGLRPQEVAA